jgi:hypothetical protein
MREEYGRRDRQVETQRKTNTRLQLGVFSSVQQKLTTHMTVNFDGCHGKAKLENKTLGEAK